MQDSFAFSGELRPLKLLEFPPKTNNPLATASELSWNLALRPQAPTVNIQQLTFNDPGPSASFHARTH